MLGCVRASQIRGSFEFSGSVGENLSLQKFWDNFLIEAAKNGEWSTIADWYAELQNMSLDKKNLLFEYVASKGPFLLMQKWVQSDDSISPESLEGAFATVWDAECFQKVLLLLPLMPNGKIPVNEKSLYFIARMGIVEAAKRVKKQEDFIFSYFLKNILYSHPSL